MEFMLLFFDRRNAPPRDPAGIEALAKLVGELRQDGTFRGGAPLRADAAAARIRVRDGETSVIDGPCVESDEVLGGFWLVEAASRDEAIDLARRAFETGEPRPEAREGVLEVHRVLDREIVPNPGRGTSYLLAYRMEPGLSDPDGSKMAEMIAFGEALKRDGKLVETAPLAREPRPARVHARDGKTLVTDGPFAETKDAVGGYGIVRATSRAEAVEIAKRVPHARWGPIELREIG